ncbi:MAG: hypothetical protein OXI86_23155 [Candidatus Poribacteria bacterium]|nr:hypothetical protein [Candidatus Poribacteria bacterium]
MMKIPKRILVCCILGLMTATAFAGKGVKLIGVDKGATNSHVCVDIIGDSLILGGFILAHNKKDSIAIIFEWDGKKWNRTAELHPGDRDPANPGAGDFAWSVSISRVGQRGSADSAAVGAPQDDAAGAKSGSAYIFARSGKNWKQQGKLIAGDGAAGDAFGFAVSIHGTTAVVGAPKDDDDGSNSGSAYVFVRDGNSWNQHLKLVPQNLGKSSAFGEAVLIVGDTVIVGAPGHTHGDTRFAGAVYIFTREGDAWRQKAKLTANDAAASDRFGNSLALSGKTLLVGAPLRDTQAGKDAGVVYVFSLDGDTWKHGAKLAAKGTRKNDHFGTSVATTGKIAIIGANVHEENALASGAAYSFVNVDGVWEERERVVPEDAGLNTRFGTWVAMSENTVVVSAGAAPHNVAARSTGTAAYVYSSIEDFGTPPFAVQPFGLAVTTLGQMKRTALHQNFPNPFNPETWLPYRLATGAPVIFGIYNVHGQLVRELNLGVQAAGDYLSREAAAYWDGMNQSGEMVSSGVYFYTLQAGTFQSTRRMLILK